MKKLVISLLLAAMLLSSLALVACGGDEYDDSEKPQTVEPHPDESGTPDTDNKVETDGSLGVAEDTEEGWGEIHR